MFESVAKRFFMTGGLTLRLPDGRLVPLGSPEAERTSIVLAVKSAGTLARLVRRPALALGEAYMNGDVVLEEGRFEDLLDLLGRNLALRIRKPAKSLSSLAAWARRRREQRNERSASRRNVAHHYDLSLDLYRRFLDEDLQYSCAYFAHPQMSLEEAQAAKKAHIMDKLLLEPGHRVLDIGCGWGGMALSLAERGAEAYGVTLSAEQLKTAQERAAARGLSQRAQFELRDYRDVEGPFDRIVSVGMFEHVGVPNYDAYFQNVARLLKDDGVALIHSIGRSEGPGTTQPWIAKYIFPGGYIPALSEVLPAIERAGLLVTDVEILRLHYAETLKHWRSRFEAQRGEIAALYDERFCRMWEFYLGVSEISFRYGDHMVFQIQLAKRIDAVPLTRDYLYCDDHRSSARRSHAA